MIKQIIFLIFFGLVLTYSSLAQSPQKERAAAPSMPALSTKTIRVYPNPVKETLSIENPTRQKIKEIVIVNHLGRFITKIQVDKNSPDIDVSDLKRGIYRLVIITKDGLKLSRAFVKE